MSSHLALPNETIGCVDFGSRPPPVCCLCGVESTLSAAEQHIAFVRSLDATPRSEPITPADVLEVLQGMRGPYGKTPKRYAHTMCLRTTVGVERLNDGSLLHCKSSIRAALMRECDICGNYGAGTKCLVDGCDVWFHALCTIHASDSLCQMKAFVVRCRDHPGDIEDKDTSSEHTDSEDDYELEPAVGGGT